LFDSLGDHNATKELLAIHVQGEAIEKSGAPERRFDAYPWRHPVTESSYINTLANRPYRSTVKTLPATLPEP